MKIYRNIKELLEAYDKYQNEWNRRTNDGMSEKIVNDFLAFNSLALGKPEPLAKNKQFEKSCKHKNGSLVRMAFKCDDCGEVFETK